MAIKHKRLSGGRAHSLMNMTRNDEGIGMIVLMEGDHDLGTARQVTYIRPLDGDISNPQPDDPDHRERSDDTIDLRDASRFSSYGWKRFDRGERIMVTVPRSPDGFAGRRRRPNVAVCVCYCKDE